MERIRYRLVFNRRKILNGQGKALIQVEASLNKKKIYISTKTYVRPSEWDSRTSTVINHPHAVTLNAWLYNFMFQFEAFELSMWKRDIVPTLMQLKECVLNNRPLDITFASFCKSVIENSNRAKATKANLQGTLAWLYKFRSNYTWEDFTYTFLREFEQWMLKEHICLNTVAKHLRNLRTFINEAIAAGYMQSDANPFKKFSIKQKHMPHRFLNPEELQRMENLQVTGRLVHILDAFLFCCYTGLRISDFKGLKEEHFQKLGDINWLSFRTQKTGSEVKIPLSLIFEGKAMEILKRYSSVADFIRIGSNTKISKCMAEIQRLAHINTRITFHTARHTCATLLCHQGVPITTVQRILGHSRISTTQLYSEVMADTIVRDLIKVRELNALPSVQ